MNTNKKEDIHERKWQVAFKNFVKNNNGPFKTQSKKNINILSLGTHNNFEGGPDFHNACIQIDGQLVVGDIEFHKKSSN
jgi:hypothetical protein